ASATLRLGHCTGPKQNANRRSGPVRNNALYLGATPRPNPRSWRLGTKGLYAVNRTFHLLIKPDNLTCYKHAVAPSDQAHQAVEPSCVNAVKTSGFAK